MSLFALLLIAAASFAQQSARLRSSAPRAVPLIGAFQFRLSDPGKGLNRLAQLSRVPAGAFKVPLVQDVRTFPAADILRLAVDPELKSLGSGVLDDQRKSDLLAVQASVERYAAGDPDFKSRLDALKERLLPEGTLQDAAQRLSAFYSGQTRALQLYEPDEPDSQQDYYEILGVSETASQDEIAANYKKLARQFHPDVNRGSKRHQKRMQAVNAANDTLGNSESRARYDKMRPLLAMLGNPGFQTFMNRPTGDQLAKSFAGFLAQRYPSTPIGEPETLIDSHELFVDVLYLNYRSHSALLDNKVTKEMDEFHKRQREALARLAPDSKAKKEIFAILEKRIIRELAEGDFGNKRQSLAFIHMFEQPSEDLLIAQLEAGIHSTFDLHAENAFEIANNAFQGLHIRGKEKPGPRFYFALFSRYLELEKQFLLVRDFDSTTTDIGRDLLILIRTIPQDQVPAISGQLLRFMSEVQNDDIKVSVALMLAALPDPKFRLKAKGVLTRALEDSVVENPAQTAQMMLRLFPESKEASAFLRKQLEGPKHNEYMKLSIGSSLLENNRTDRAALKYLAREGVKLFEGKALLVHLFPRNARAVARLIAAIGEAARTGKHSNLTDYDMTMRYRLPKAVIDEYARHRNAMPESDRSYFDDCLAEMRKRQV